MSRPMYTPAQAEEIRQEARERGLEADDSFWSATAEELAEAMNGIGPDWFSFWSREKVTENQGRFRGPAGIHDWDYKRSTGRWADFCAANERFLRNCRRTVRKTISVFRWWKRREMMIDADLLYGAVCAGGWPGYKAGANMGVGDG